MLEHPGIGICRFQSVKILYTLALIIGYHALWDKIDGNKSHLLIADLTYGIRLEQPLQSGAVKPVIGTEFLSIEPLYISGKRLHAVVKFMITENLDVILQFIHHFLLHFTSEKGEIKRSLHSIAGIYEHHIRFGSTHTVNQHFAA